MFVCLFVAWRLLFVDLLACLFVVCGLCCVRFVRLFGFCSLVLFDCLLLICLLVVCCVEGKGGRGREEGGGGGGRCTASTKTKT